MHVSLEGLPIARELPGFEGRWTESGDWHFAYQKAAAGSNLDRVLAIYDDQACRVEHWGYVFEGRVRIQFVEWQPQFPQHQPGRLVEGVGRAVAEGDAGRVQLAGELFHQGDQLHGESSCSSTPR